ncbi:AAA family ATPase [Halobellus clavatus]|uniref:Dephospho-CoA kinase n=1 Tax=Halobellus clavatus TaxID=660517 RepID=A0A1H3EEW4_9EURY|nr:AAA family ATPase [Halobellus clavatus]SDX77155.1 Dephospho-CoA kinase [Halobellus clavatus]
MKVIGTVGLPGSGKGEAAAVAREADVPVVTMGDVIREACRERGFDPAEHHGEMARTLREEDGPAAIAERSLPLIESELERRDAVLVDGLRSDVELDRFREAFGEDFLLVSIEAPFEIRAERLLDRARDDSDLDREALRHREERELGFGMGEVMDRADVVIRNTDTLAAFRDRIRAVLDGDLADVAGDDHVDVAIEAADARDDPTLGSTAGDSA